MTFHVRAFALSATLLFGISPASADVTIPYHPAAVQFYKDKNLWNAKMDESQKRLLAVNP